MMKKFLTLLLILSFSTSVYSDEKKEVYKYLNLFGEAFEKIKNNYVEEVTVKKLIESAIDGMLNSLDPHSSYLNTEKLDELRVQTKGEFGGLGIEVTMEDGFVKVITPIDDTPAFEAGIKPGDLIIEIDGGSVKGLSLNQAVDLMRGKVGEPILLSIARKGENGPLEIKIVRAKLKLKA